MTRYFIIINPTAGRGAGERAIAEIERELHNLDFELACTQRPWHAAELAQQAAKDQFDVIVAVGGDGTANEVINGLMQAKKAGYEQSALGILSVGRGNDFGFGAGIPSELIEACKVLKYDHRAPLDIGFVTGGLYPQGRYFGNGVGIGFDAVVGFEASKMKRLHGFASYLVAALKTIFLYYKAPSVRIEFDGQRLELQTLMISIMNGRRMGGGFMMAPRAMTDDSLFDLCIASQVSRARIFALIPRFMQGTQASDPAIQTAQTRSLSVKALHGVLPAHADGETLCTEGTELALEILPRQLEVITTAPPRPTEVLE